MYAESAEEESDEDEDAEDDIGDDGSFSDVDDLDSESPHLRLSYYVTVHPKLFRRRRSSSPRIVQTRGEGSRILQVPPGK